LNFSLAQQAGPRSVRCQEDAILFFSRPIALFLSNSSDIANWP